MACVTFLLSVVVAQGHAALLPLMLEVVAAVEFLHLHLPILLLERTR